MKKYLPTFLWLFVAGCGTQKDNKDNYKMYGQEISSEGAVSLIDLEKELSRSDSMVLTVSGTIEKTCPKKGCWMTVRDENGNAIRVTFKDYSFFVPTEGAEGKEVVFTGLARRKVTDVATLRHFAEDAGKSPEEIESIVTPEEEIEFVADGVIIFDGREGSEN